MMTNVAAVNTGYRQQLPGHHSLANASTMPTKAHRPGLTRTHSRSSSGGGGSKLGLNLQLTQKEAAPSRYSDKPKKNNHLHHESNGRISRNSSSARLQSREHIHPPNLRRAPPPSHLKQSSSKHKPDFNISNAAEGDDDEWVSSESGAATPVRDSDGESTTPVDQKPTITLPTVQTNGFIKDDIPTPKVEASSLPRTEATQGAPGSLPTERDYVPIEHAHMHQLMLPPSPHKITALLPQPEPELSQPQIVASAATKARSETHSPPRRSPDTHVRHSMTRPPSTHSIASNASHPLRPHPLIRAHSIGHSMLGQVKPTPLAPLTTVPADAVPVTTSPTSYRAVSPALSTHTSVSPTLSNPSPSTSEASKQLRRTSISSRSSTATIPSTPLVPSASHVQLTKATAHDRQRTLSSSSTFAALSSLGVGMRGAPSPPKTPLPQITAHFPPAEQLAQLEAVHPLLPPPYLSAHLTMLAYRNPLGESYERVMRAKQAQIR